MSPGNRAATSSRNAAVRSTPARASRWALRFCAAEIARRKAAIDEAIAAADWSKAQADQFRASIWQGSDYPIWEAFIGDMQTRMGG